MTEREKEISDNLAELSTPARPLDLTTGKELVYANRCIRSIWSEDMSSLQIELLNQGKVVAGFAMFPQGVKALAWTLMMRTHQYETEKGEITYET